MIRRVFPGGNTSRGFFSYYDYIIEKDANRIFVLKGGPGTGKSSLMKKVAHIMLDKGFDIEFHHCSSDNDSVDGLVIPALRVAMIDGTAPHVVDPKIPGAVDEIIHLGDYWKVEGLEKNKKEIIQSIERNGKYYKRAYKYFGSARLILEDIFWKKEEALQVGLLNKEMEQWVHKIVGEFPIKDKVGKVRHLFGSAYTPNGYVDYTKEHIGIANKIYFVKGDYGTGKTTFLTKIYQESVKRGFDVEVFHTPLIPEKIISIIIKELGIAFSTSEIIEDIAIECIDLDQFLKEDVLMVYEKDIEEDKEVYNSLIDIAISNLTQAKKNHDNIEGFYIPNMNFEVYEPLIQNIVKRMLKYGND